MAPLPQTSAPPQPEPTAAPMAKSSVPFAAIIGAVLGGMLLLVVGGAVVRWRKRRKTPDYDVALSRVPTLAHSPGPKPSPSFTSTAAQTPPVDSPDLCADNGSRVAQHTDAAPPYTLSYTPPPSRIPVLSQTQPVSVGSRR
ncbi:hypothetical protein CC85DRAFT_329483 [Cutaneotrichosporon oleaginosum]|uniref:Uncharacterized protein n=1 Tax=Cutaneotrichosporon oleaginosum TaxID=879819 RepID=A0A0J0XIK7_9TREE|nr:uncharacterized protein CC85DRAFT_329483 [Cutaneotrichosporon oleaginosum]KLT40916.1 hypothetical protein CC85DRAFT_329483 [Cutaneotrichosporon oleaginosum]TXT15409.1 hypothetical protein COLE_01602 [Cutaneotrichosporon oleaginosum]